jgi:hypothetical protein
LRDQELKAICRRKWEIDDDDIDLLDDEDMEAEEEWMSDAIDLLMNDMDDEDNTGLTEDERDEMISAKGETDDDAEIVSVGKVKSEGEDDKQDLEVDLLEACDQR